MVKCGISRTIAGWLTPMICWPRSVRPNGFSSRTDTTREFFLLVNYTNNELQGINILKLRLPNGLKCCLTFFYCRNG